MKQFTYKEYMFVEVPMAARGFSFSTFAHVPKERLEWWIDTFGGSEYGCIDLPPGQYSIVGKADELTEEQYEEILKESDLNKICMEDGGGYVIESGFKVMAEAWLKFKSVKSETTIILKIEKI